MARKQPRGQDMEKQPGRGDPGHRGTPVDPEPVPIDAGAGRIIQTGQHEPTLPHYIVVREHDSRHGTEEDAVPSHDGKEVTRTIHELLRLHDESKARSEIAPTAKIKVTRQQSREVDAIGQRVLGDRDAKLRHDKSQGGKGHSNPRTRGVVEMGLHGGQQAVRLPQQRAVDLVEELGGAGGAQDVDQSHRDGAEGHNEQLRQELDPGAAHEAGEVRLAGDVRADATDISADAEDQHPPEAAPLALLNAGDGDVGDQGPGSVSLCDAAYQETRTVGATLQAAMAKGILYFSGGTQMSGRQIDHKTMKAVKSPVSIVPWRGEDRFGALAPPQDLRRIPDEREHDALRQREQRAVDALRRLLQDGEADVPLGPWRAREHADDADENVADDDGEHGLPDVEPESDDRGAGHPATDVKGASDDPEAHELPGTIDRHVRVASVKRPAPCVPRIRKPRPFTAVLPILDLSTISEAQLASETIGVGNDPGFFYVTDHGIVPAPVFEAVLQSLKS
ncbi:oxidoreductase [Fusarium denticulatum]|uniref:Oxidoreductase n=1 Tax=Fusarium denticulatum TaxID=48507 RepID=A0A8H5TRE4_9HYPO|nr:oxidoreductase [Fusarium denticulatum]